jgi:hypothetical protein
MNKLRYLFSLLLCLPIAFACKKSSSHPSNACRIAVNYDSLFLPGGNEADVTRIFYDNDGRVAYTQTNTSNDSITRVFIYNDSSVVITPTNIQSPYDTIVMNGKGMPVKIKQTYISNDYYDLSIYSYDATGQLQSAALSQANNSGANLRTATYTYKFVDGDCVSTTYTDANGTSTTNYTYYTDKPVQDGDYQRFQNISSYGTAIIRNKHLLRSAQSGTYISDYSYTFDNTGRIATATYRYNDQVFKNTYEYDCSQQ